MLYYWLPPDGKDRMDSTYISKEQVALELTIALIEKALPTLNDWSPEGAGKGIARLFNSIYENLKEE